MWYLCSTVTTVRLRTDVDIFNIAVIWLYFALKIFRTLLFRAVLISYAPNIIYETRVKVSLLKNIRAFNFRTDGSVRN